MANPYREIFKAPGSLKFSFFGFIARMPFAMISISIIAMLNQIGYSYSQASYVAASYIVSCAIIAPQLSKFADLYGQTRIILMGSTLASLSLSSLVLCALHNAGLIPLMILALGCGFMPNFGAFVRARWSFLYRNSKKKYSAFAFESIVDEVIYMIGPVIAIALTTNFASAAGPLSAVTFLVIGSLAFITQKITEPPAHKHKHKTKSSVLNIPKIRLLTFILLAIGIIYGAIEVSVFAFSKQLNQQSYAAVPIASYALGSFISGIVYGLFTWKKPLTQQFFIMIILAALTTLPLCSVSNIWDLSFVLFLAGVTCSPTIIIAMTLVESIVPEHKLTEGMTWAATGMSIGVSIGAALSGSVIDKFNPMSGFYVAMFAAFIELSIALFSYRPLKQETRNILEDL